MKKLLLKTVIVALPFLIIVLSALHYDTFNVFHWRNIRFTSAEPNKNFVKTQYIIHNPKKFNAFVFGSSRVNYIPLDVLPKEADGKSLRWYNMTYSEGIPAEHLQTVRTFLKNGVKIGMIMLGFDNIAMYASIGQHEQQLLRMPFQVYEESPFRFYAPYLKNITARSIIKEVSCYNAAKKKTETERFYDWGGSASDFVLTENPKMERYVSDHDGKEFTQKNAYKDIAAIVELCRENGIALVLFTSPLYETTYRDAAENGYFDFLQSVAGVAEFYNFSSLNSCTTNPQYYFESSHYRPALGLLVEKMLFGTDEERERIRRDADDVLWGARVNAGNVEEIIAHLQGQLDAGK
ncbi:MAG: hypothetical protein J1E59_08840 [Treponema sp.]|nr:hypothetical protein [Treponema sp.]